MLVVIEMNIRNHLDAAGTYSLPVTETVFGNFCKKKSQLILFFNYHF